MVKDCNSPSQMRYMSYSRTSELFRKEIYGYNRFTTFTRARTFSFHEHNIASRCPMMRLLCNVETHVPMLSSKISQIVQFYESETYNINRRSKWRPDMGWTVNLGIKEVWNTVRCTCERERLILFTTISVSNRNDPVVHLTYFFGQICRLTSDKLLC